MREAQSVPMGTAPLPAARADTLTAGTTRKNGQAQWIALAMYELAWAFHPDTVV